MSEKKFTISIKGIDGIKDGTEFEISKGFDGFKELKGIDKAAFDELEAADMAKLYSEYNDVCMKAVIEAAKDGAKGNEEILATLKADMQESMQKLVAKNQEVLKDMARGLKEIAEGSNKVSGDKETLEVRMKAAFDEKEEEWKSALLKSTPVISMLVDKAEATYGDIDSGLDFASMKPGITNIVVRRPRIRSLFKITPVSTEFHKYVEQNTVVRDAQNVAKCAPVTSLTKETVIVRSIETKVIKDTISFCRLYVADYPFMKSRINSLLNESLALHEDNQLLHGTGLGEEINSIDLYSSEFSAANPVCVLTDKIQAANMVDLILGMRTQISKLGELNAFNPNFVLVDLCDWFVDVESRKDLNNNYLDARVTVVNGIPYVAGMMVIPLQNVGANTLYLFDSTKAEIVDRMKIEIETAFQNRDNWEKEIAEMKGMMRLNFLSPNNWHNAFMKCSDIAAAVIAINKL